ncbi:MAG: hypothetical protein JW759_05245 [Candidatus Coatesbacteria bacterium]|nr:hypothetical protein [Candidatus Coatesbacteria bacterium]
MTTGVRERSHVLIFVILAAAVFVLALFRIMNYDIWFLFKTGELILQTGAVPTSDPFSYTSFGTPWTMHEWLFCVLAELVRRYLGLELLIVLKAIAVAAGFTLILAAAAIRAKLNRDALVATASLLVLAACASRFRFDVMPDIFTFVGIAGTILLVELFYAGRRKWLLLLPPLTLVWANVQAGAVIGPIYLWLRLGCDTVSSRFGREHAPNRPPAALPLLLAALASTAALFVNPYGLRILNLAHAVLWEHRVGGSISVLEWTPPDLRFQLFWVLLAAVWALFVTNIRKCRLLDVAEILLGTALALSARRFIPTFFLLATPAVGRMLARGPLFLGDGAPRWRASKIALVAGPLLAGICVAATLIYHGAFVPGLGVNLGAYPAGGVNFVIKHNISGNMYNSHRFGGYIIFRTYPGRRVFIDGRNVEHKALWEKFAKEPFERIADEYGIDYAILDYVYDSRRQEFSAQSARAASLAPGSPSAQRLLDWWNRHAGWHLVFWDDNCAVYVDGSEKFREVRDQFEYEFLDPAAPGFGYLIGCLADKNTRPLVIEEAERAVSQSPDAISCQALRAWILSSPTAPAPGASRGD